jgi:hypothetical protein
MRTVLGYLMPVANAMAIMTINTNAVTNASAQNKGPKLFLPVLSSSERHHGNTVSQRLAFKKRQW